MSKNAANFLPSPVCDMIQATMERTSHGPDVHRANLGVDDLSRARASATALGRLVVGGDVGGDVTDLNTSGAPKSGITRV